MAKRKNGTKKGAANDSRKKNKKHEAPNPIPVTILSGFLGSGKTTLLQHILTSKEHNLKIAVIVNDMAELNVDGQTIRRMANPKDDNEGAGGIVQTKREVVTLENGCICCTLRGDLIREIHRLKESQQFDYVLIESTGIAEPQECAESFCVDPETMLVAGNDEKMLWNSARLDTCVTVVDAVNFPNYLSSLKRFQDVFKVGTDGSSEEEESEGEKSISELMIAQVEFANVILLHKVDLVSPEKLEIAKTLIKALNPKARLVTGSFGNVDLSYILNTHLFDMAVASESPGWAVSLKDGVNAAEGEADEYGISSFVYRSRRPFHPYRLHSFLKHDISLCFAEEWNSKKSWNDADDDGTGITDDAAVIKNNSNYNNHSNANEKKYGAILRSKGTCWIAGRDDYEITWAHTGRIIQLLPIAPWYVKVPREEWEGVDTEKDLAAVEARFVHSVNDDASGGAKNVPYENGDRRQGLVFIGTKLQSAAMEDALNDCLLNDEEMENHSTASNILPVGTYPDPFLHPLVVSCDSPQSLFMIARHGQHQHVNVLPGFVLTLQNLALDVFDDDADDGNGSGGCRVKAVKVWLDKSVDGSNRGILLATLRPNVYEQHSLEVSILANDEDDEGGEEEEVASRRIRVEVVPSAKNMKKTTTVGGGDDGDLMKSCAVHIFGKIDILPYSPAAANEDNQDGHDHDMEENATEDETEDDDDNAE